MPQETAEWDGTDGMALLTGTASRSPRSFGLFPIIAGAGRVSCLTPSAVPNPCNTTLHREVHHVVQWQWVGVSLVNKTLDKNRYRTMQCVLPLHPLLAMCALDDGNMERYYSVNDGREGHASADRRRNDLGDCEWIHGLLLRPQCSGQSFFMRELLSPESEQSQKPFSCDLYRVSHQLADLD